MKDLIDILCWLINLIRGFAELFGIDSSFIDEITGNLQNMVK